MKELRTTWETREENKGELRLVAWVAGTTGGQVIEPAVDRQRGFTAVMVHLQRGSPPSPDARRYNLLAEGGPRAERRDDARRDRRVGVRCPHGAQEPPDRKSRAGRHVPVSK